MSPARRPPLLAAAAAAVAATLTALTVVLLAGLDRPGTDDAAMAAIERLAPGYIPWVRPAWAPPSATVEVLLFALQAALGAAVLAFILARRRRLRPPQAAGDGPGEDRRCG
jgi:cobalt/nickel transport protein